MTLFAFNIHPDFIKMLVPQVALALLVFLHDFSNIGNLRNAVVAAGEL